MDIQAVRSATTEAELVGFMARRAKDPKLADAAWEALYLRHVHYVWSICSRAVLDQTVAEDVVVETFLNARNWAARQDDVHRVTRDFTGDDPDHTRLKVRRWLGVIANRELQDHFRNEKTATEALDRYVESELRRSPTTEVEQRSTEEAQLVRDALESLPREKADALRVSLPWYDADTRTFALPRGEAARLAESLGITVDALRQRRFRALAHLASFLQQATATRKPSNLQ